MGTLLNKLRDALRSKDSKASEEAAVTPAPSTDEQPVADDAASTSSTAALMDVVDPTVEKFTSAALGQVVSMLGEDARTYLQGMEQIYTAAAGKALGMIASQDPDQQKAGLSLLNHIRMSQKNTSDFAKDIATVAKNFVSIKG
ncbi:hypothetical protein [Rhizobium paknamense]|uniref:Uncharacterized protein n=1 Tax=Rhizobium paknamense TaxID=1206817 RepID=A0ABU0IDA3_9HYPH|nr:hypothetical protein [Rhizobium paknamense]MDQ0456214.1 hypothetical protein [Rhizobium paknamense]